MKKKFNSMRALLLVILVLTLAVGMLSGCSGLGEELIGPLGGELNLIL